MLLFNRWKRKLIPKINILIVILIVLKLIIILTNHLIKVM